MHTYNPDNNYLCYAFGLTLNDGQHAKTEFYKVNNEYVMPATPLNEIRITYRKYEDCINHLTLVYADGTTKRLGWSDGNDGRVDRYLFAKDEHLIGATIEHD